MKKASAFTRFAALGITQNESSTSSEATAAAKVAARAQSRGPSSAVLKPADLQVANKTKEDK